MAEANTTAQNILAFLQEPSSYPQHPSEVRVLQTHASVVAISPPYVYKVKKHVNLGFLDFTSLEKRKRNCEQEYELNSRFCPDLYMAVVPIALKHGRLHFGTEGEVVDYALQMRQLPDGFFMDQLLQASQVTAEMLEAVLAELKTFYESHPSTPAVSIYGDSAQIRASIEENITTLQLYIQKGAQRASLDAISRYQDSFLKDKLALFEKRVQENKIQDCHGDLHLDHIHIYQGRVCIFDCIEFNDRFRYIDVASDIAFLAMDLDFHRRPDLALYVSDRMAALLQDQDMGLLMDFYKCYRACVRAKVELIESMEKEVPAPKRKASRVKAKAYQRLALRYAITGNRPAVLIICGRIGSGKSTLARKMAGSLDCAYLCSDAIRKEKWGLPLFQRTAPEVRNRLYTPEVTTQVYEQMLDQTLAEIKARRSVVVDASFGQPRLRAAFIQALRELKVSFYFVEMQASDEEIRERLAKREASSQVVSDARLEDFRRLSRDFQEPTEVPEEHLIQVNSSGASVDSLLEYMLRRIQDLNGRSGKRGEAAG